MSKQYTWIHQEYITTKQSRTQLYAYLMWYIVNQDCTESAPWLVTFVESWLAVWIGLSFPNNRPAAVCIPEDSSGELLDWTLLEPSGVAPVILVISGGDCWPAVTSGGGSAVACSWAACCSLASFSACWIIAWIREHITIMILEQYNKKDWILQLINCITICNFQFIPWDPVMAAWILDMVNTGSGNAPWHRAIAWANIVDKIPWNPSQCVSINRNTAEIDHKIYQTLYFLLTF